MKETIVDEMTEEEKKNVCGNGNKYTKRSTFELSG